MTLNTITATAGDATGSVSFTVGQRAAAKIGAVVSPLGGCPSSVHDWLTLGEATFGAGRNQVCKQFYSDGQPLGTFQAGHKTSDNESQLPPYVLTVVTVKDSHLPQLPGYVASIPDDGRIVVVVGNQEAEDWYPGQDFAAYIANMIKLRDAVHGQGKPNVFFAQDSAGSKYGDPSGTPAQGKWAVPGCDFYAIDCYQNQAAGKWPSKGLANYPNWLNWAAIYTKLGKPVALAEYGLNACSGTAARQARLQQDHDYLISAFPQYAGQPGTWLSPFPLAWWCYWWSDCQAGQITTDCGHQHQFTDAPTLATWQAIMDGTA